jgi:hypothetical protein
MSTRMDQTDTPQSSFKPPVASPREALDPPVPDFIVSKNVIMERKSASPLDVACPRPQDRQERIAHAAYYLAERRGFEPGHEMEDWLAAESQIDNEPL